MERTKNGRRGSRPMLRALVGGLTALGIAVLSTGAGMGCADPCANAVEEKNDECSFTNTYDGSCSVGYEACIDICHGAHTCDEGEQPMQDCYDGCAAA